VPMLVREQLRDYLLGLISRPQFLFPLKRAGDDVAAIASYWFDRWVPLGLSLDKCMVDFWIIVTKAASELPVTYILTLSEVRANAHRGEKDGRVSYWLQQGGYEQSQFKEAWNRIGHGGLDSQPSSNVVA
jgi:hypothetical protein